MNVLIADDEYLVRASLKSMIKELDLGITIVGEASDGEDLVKKVLELKPDLVYADIKMPKMNGLDSIKAAKQQSPETEWIILTGFPVFEYAKEALRLGVQDYLLKPISPKDLRTSIAAVLDKKTERQKKLNYKFTQDVMALFNNIIALSDLQDTGSAFAFNFKGAFLSFDSYLDEGESVKCQRKFWSLALNLKTKFVDHNVRIAYINMPDGNFAAIFAWDPDSMKGKEKADSFFDQLTNIAKTKSTDNCSETVLCCDECDSFDQLKNNLCQLKKLAPLKILAPGDSVGLNDLKNLTETLSPQTISLAKNIIDISEKYRNGSYSEYIKAVDQMGYYLSSKKLLIDTVKPFYRILQHCCSQSDLNKVKTPQSLIEILKKNGNKNFRSRYEPCDLVDQVKTFVNSNYMKNIGISQIANQLNVTPNYLSTLFHKKTGDNFIHYITSVRLLKARELLLSAEKPAVNQIANEVGYYAVNYFTKLYKEYFGVCPSEDAAKMRK